MNLNTTNGVGSSGAATFSGITDAWLTSLSITSPSSGPLTLGTITPAPSSLINLNADNVSGFLTVAFASGSFNSGDIYSSPNIRGALGGGDYNLGNPSVATGIWLNGSTNIVRYASHTTEQQVYVRPGLTTNATIYGFGSASAQDYLKIDGGSTAVVVLDNVTHLNNIRIDVQGSGNLTITGLKGGDNIWVDAPANLNATATGAWAPNNTTANDGSAYIEANSQNIDLQLVGGTNGWTITNSGGAAASLRGSSHADTIDYSSAVAVNNSIPWGITLTLLGSSPATVIPNNTNVSADTLQDIENVIGTNGMDFIYGDVNNNTINGGAGNDIIYGGAGVDTVDYSSSLNSNGFSLATSDTGITLGLNGITRVTLDPGSTNAGFDGISYVENVIGTNGIDTITGDSNDNTINGGAGADTINGAGGVDTVDYSSALKSGGSSLATSDAGIHLTLQGFIDVTLNPGGSDVGADNISNVENVIGTNGIDTITGDNSNNMISGGGGADTINGGDGVDTFVYAAITDFIADNAIVDSIVGGNGTDTIGIDQTSAFTIANTDSFARASTIEALAIGAANDGDISITLNADAFTAGIRTVTLAGDTNSSGNNTINASSQGSGAISLTLTGSAGQDTIIGGNGADVITGGNGADILTGGIGPDIFAYTGNQSSNMAQTGNVVTGAIDVITDFTTSVDRIDLEVSGVGEFAGTGQANSNYADAYNHATSRFSAQGVYYIVEAYSSGSTWTSVLFARNNPDISSPNPTGAIQIGIVGAYSTSTAALAAILESDII